MAPDSEKNAGTHFFLHIDHGCPLFIQQQDSQQRLKSKLAGLVPGAYLIVSTPETSGALDLRPGAEQIIIRYIIRGEVLGFKSSVIAVIENPFPAYVHLIPGQNRKDEPAQGKAHRLQPSFNIDA